MQDLVNGLISLFIGAINILLAPINTIINTYIPDMSEFITNLSPYFAMIDDFIPWIKDLFCLPQYVYTLIVAFITYRIIAMIGTNTYKLVLKYWETLV